MKDRSKLIIDDFFNNHADLIFLKNNILDCVNLIIKMYKSGNKILVCGNGGSCADSEHISGELLKSFKLKRSLNNKLANKLEKDYKEEGSYISKNLQEGVKCIPLTCFTAFNTAFSNDCDEKMTFAQLVNVLGDSGDVLISISTSGNSKNVLYASKIAKVKNIKIVALTGETGGKLKDICDILINVPSKEVYKIQEYHLPIYHLICLLVESEIFND